MRNARVSAIALLVAGFGAACSSSDQFVGEPVAQRQQRLGTEYVPGSAGKVCQLVGDTDWQTGQPTGNLSEQRNAIGNTDLGYPVLQRDRNRIWFFYGDVDGDYDVKSPDPVAFVSASGDPCKDMRFTAHGPVLSAVRVNTDTLVGFQVPTGLVYDDENSRFIGHFMIRPGEDNDGDPNKNNGYFATAPSRNADGSFDDFFFRKFVTIDGAPVDDHFLLVAPAIVERSEVPVDLPGSPSQKVLVVWGEAKPYRQGAIYLAAVSLDRLHDARSWRFFGTANTWTDNPAFAAPVFTPEPVQLDDRGQPRPCRGEFSVVFDEVSRQWMMAYGCGNTDAPGRPAVGEPPIANTPAILGSVRLRTAKHVVGPWSPPVAIYLPKLNGIPGGGDPGYNQIIHQANPRAWRPDPFGPLVRILEPASDPFQEEFPIPLDCPGLTPEKYPPFCAGVRLVEDEFNPFIGCCLKTTDRCCDFVGSPTKGSTVYGGIYAPYLVAPYAKATELIPFSGIPKSEEIQFVMSTWNPYTVFLMKSELNYPDVDGDGRPNEIDNCPMIFNPDQANCNIEAERAWNVNHPGQHVDELGDACDPVPCPEAKKAVVTATVVKRGECDRNPYSPTLCEGREIRDRVDVNPIGAHRVEAFLSATVPIQEPPPSFLVRNVATHPRFCQHNPARNFDCTDPTKLRDEQLTFYPTAGAEIFDPAHPWHRILRTIDCPSQRFETLECARGFGARGTPFFADYGDGSSSFGWNYKVDNDFWTDPTKNPNAPIIPQGTDPGCTDVNRFGAGTCLDGRMWLHADTPVGATSDRTPDGEFVGLHGPELANYYFDRAPDLPFVNISGGFRFKFPFFLWRTLPDPPPWRFREGVAAPIILESDSLLTVFESGLRADATPHISASLRAALFDTQVVWLASQEPSPYAGPAGSPIAVSISKDATSVSTAAIQSEGRLTRAAHWFGEGSGCTIDSDSCFPSPASSMASTPSDAPAARHDFSAVYSKARARVLVAGGARRVREAAR